MVPRKPSLDGKRIPLSVKVSWAKAAQIDEARGDTTRAAWLAAAIDRYLEPARPALPPEGFEDLRAVAELALDQSCSR